VLQEPGFPKQLLEDVVMYGEMVQAVYDTLLTKDVYSQCFGECYPDEAMTEGTTLGSIGGPDGYFPYFVGPKAGQYKVGQDTGPACKSLLWLSLSGFLCLICKQYKLSTCLMASAVAHCSRSSKIMDLIYEHTLNENAHLPLRPFSCTRAGLASPLWIWPTTSMH
jgi:hypothetical protein